MLSADVSRGGDEPTTKPKLSRDEMLKKADTFVPKYNYGYIYGGPEHIAAVYSRRIEFFNVPPGVDVIEDRGGGLYEPDVAERPWHSCGHPGRPKFLKDGKQIHLKPHKVVRFAYNINAVSEGSEAEIRHPCQYILVSTNMQSPLSIEPSTTEEMGLVKLRPKRKWNSGKSEYDEFYGMFSVDGKLVFRAYEKARMPDKWIYRWYIQPDGKMALFAIGRVVLFDDGNYSGETLGCVKQVLIWTKGSGVKRVPLEEAMKRYPVLLEISGYNDWTKSGPECK